LFVNALTIDVEDWFHPELVRKRVDVNLSQGRLPQSIGPILDLLDRYKVKATFFILGDSASRFPELVRQVYKAGHEVACHGMSHRILADLGEDGFRKELDDFKNLMKEILGDVQIKGFRAPTFSLDQETKWALPILRDFGYLYDSSIFPAKFFWNPLYGLDDAPRFPYRISFADPRREDRKSPLWEFPAAIARFGKCEVPAGGGFYLRVIPFWLFKWASKRINKTGPFFLFLHPWESDIHTPRVPLPLLSRGATYYGIGSVLFKLEGLLKTFSFSRMDEVLEKLGAAG
jgi:peptidoglycan-N-acetylglucosamine deacetylase